MKSGLYAFPGFFATLSVFAIVGTVGGMQWGNIAIPDGILRVIVLMVLTAKLHKYAEMLYTKQRKKRRAHRSTSSVSSV